MHRTCLAIVVTFLITTLSIPAFAAMRPIIFAVPPWPGGVVKAEVASQILEALGYPTELKNMDTTEAFQTLESGDTDVYLSAWLPTQLSLLSPLLKKKAVHVAGINVANAQVGLCVPGYVAAEGIKSLADVAPNAEKFDSTIYVEEGSGMSLVLQGYIKDDFAGLSKVKANEQPVDTMLEDVRKMFEEKKWVAFGCWKPHWMNITFDLIYLEGIEGSNTLIATNEVNTITGLKIKEEYPDAYTFLSRINVSTDTQGKWTYDLSLKKMPVKDLAQKWIKQNINVVTQWVGALKSADGKDARLVVKEAFK